MIEPAVVSVHRQIYNYEFIMTSVTTQCNSVHDKQIMLIWTCTLRF